MSTYFEKSATHMASGKKDKVLHDFYILTKSQYLLLANLTNLSNSGKRVMELVLLFIISFKKGCFYMTEMLKATESVLSMLIMISLGLILTHKKWFSEEVSKVFVKLVIQISLPLLMLNTITTNFNKQKLISSSKALIIPFISIFLCYLLSIVFSKIMNIDKNKKGLFKSMFFNSNTIFMGLPINMALFGEKSVPFVLLYYIGNTTFFWTVGIYEISKDSSKIKQRLFSKESLKKIFSPPLMGYLIGIIIVLLNINLPIFIKDTCKYLGNITTPISMIFIGITMYSINIKKLKLDKNVIGVLLGRFLISPILVFILTLIFPIPQLMRNVFIIQSIMPVMTNTAIIAKSYNADCDYATIMIGITTIASLFIIPIYMLIL
jgi:predicted permease